MKKTEVISYKNLPTKAPFWITCTIVLALDKYNASQWLWGSLGTILLLM